MALALGAVAFAAFAVLGGAAEETAGVSVRAIADKSEVAVGEPFAVEVKALGPPGTAFSFPAEAETDGFWLRPAPVPEGKDAPPAEPGVQRYVAAVFALSEVEIPPIPVRYRLADGTAGEVATAAVPLKVRSLLPKDPAERRLADIRGPVTLSIGRAFWLALALAVALFVAAAVWWLRRRRTAGAPAAAVVPELPPDAEALGALDALASSELLARGELRAFYIRLSFVAKRYLERRLDRPVLEMTSAETIAFLRAHPQAGDLVSTMRELSDAADRIKFARGAGQEAEASRHLAAVRALVSSLEARLRPAAEGKAA